MSTTLIVDADTCIYKAARRAEQVIQWDESMVTAHADLDEAKAELDSIIDFFVSGFDDVTEVVMALSDYEETNWRNTLVYPEYKMQREGDGIRRPLAWAGLREYIHDQHGERWTTIQLPSLEGDDVCGIMMTHPIGTDRRICISIDKDMRTIPGLHFNPDKIPLGVTDLETLIEEVSVEDADLFHLMQSLAGDPTDGFGGAPGIGLKTAEALITGGKRFVKYDHEFKSGPRKGFVETRWKKVPEENPWEIIVSAYRKALATTWVDAEREALLNARCARILRASDFDFENGEVRLWTPR